MNQPFVMVALVDSAKDASKNSTCLSEDQSSVMGKHFIKQIKKAKNFEILNHIARRNKNAMRVIIRPTDLTSEKQKEKMSVPYSSIRSINKGRKDFDYFKGLF